MRKRLLKLRQKLMITYTSEVTSKPQSNLPMSQVTFIIFLHDNEKNYKVMQCTKGNIMLLIRKLFKGIVYLYRKNFKEPFFIIFPHPHSHSNFKKIGEKPLFRLPLIANYALGTRLIIPGTYQECCWEKDVFLRFLLIVKFMRVQL